MTTRYEFVSQLDIANRAIQHTGARRITTPGWPTTEDTLQASAVLFAYDKMRTAELRRNVWSYAVRRTVLRPVDQTTMLIIAPAWSSTATYAFGSLVQDSDGYRWTSLVDGNLGQQPGSSTAWDAYFGPQTATPWNQDLLNNTSANGQLAYYAGELVYISNGRGDINVYMSLVNSNSAEPDVPTVWSASTTYTVGQVVAGSNGFYYLNLLPINLNNDPTLAPAPWDANSPYVTGNKVAALDGKVYYALAGSTGVNPVGDLTGKWQFQGQLAPWYSAFLASTSSLQWLQLNCTLRPLKFAYPAGSGPSTDTSTRNVFYLPAGYLRIAPQDPKAGSTSFLGAPTGLMYNDWTFGDRLFTTRTSSPIVFRFVADVTQVTAMDPMFCEGLSARIGYEICEEVTQSTEKKAEIGRAYKTFMSEARIENGIEQGATEPPEDDYVTCRI